MTCSFNGAKCDVCPLGPKGPLRDADRPWQPVAHEDHRMSGAEIIAVHQAPEIEDEKRGSLLSGRNGGTWARGLNNAGLRRVDVSSTTVIACAPPGAPGGAYRRMEDMLRRLNKRAAKEGLPSWPHPRDCCRPRLEIDLLGYKNVLLMGKTAAVALAGLNRDIKKTRGAPIGIDEGWQAVPHDSDRAVHLALPTLDVSFIAKNGHFMSVWVRDIAKARRLFEGTLRWRDPEMLWRPTPDELRFWLRGFNGCPDKTAVFDVETSRHHQGMRPRALKLYTLSIARWSKHGEGSTMEAVGIEFMDPSTGVRWYTPEAEAEIKDLLRRFFTEQRIPKMGHNAGMFDRAVIEEHFGVTPVPLIDSIFATRAANPGLPKGLKPTGRTFTDVGEWDSDDKDEDGGGADSKNATTLLRYNMMDCAVNLALWPTVRDIAARAGYYTPIRQDLADMMLPPERRGQPLTLNEIDHAAQDRGLRMTDAGLWIDQRLRAAMQEDAEKQAATILRLLQARLKAAGAAVLADADLDIEEDDDGVEMNPNSTARLRALYFGPPDEGGWDLPFLPSEGGVDSAGKPLYSRKDFLTGTGDMSTSDAVHRAYLASGVLRPDQFEIMYLVRVYRRIKTKIVGTTLRPLAPEQPIYKAGVLRGFTKSWVHGDNRVHSIFSAHVTNVGRYASGSPNCFSGDTQVLTKAGWVAFTDLEKGVEIAQWEPGGYMSWVVPSEYYEVHDAPFIHISTERFISLKVTPDHRCPLYDRKGDNLIVVPASRYSGERRQPSGGVLSGATTIDHNLLRYLIAVQADGSLYPTRVKLAFRLQRKIERCEEILKACGFHYTKNVYSGTTEFGVYGEGRKVIDRLLPGKKFAPWLLDLDEASKRVFCSEVFLWDGSARNGTDYASKHKENAEIVQTMIHCVGKRSILRLYTNAAGSSVWIATCSDHTSSMTTNFSSVDAGRGTAYCVSVPSSFILVRHNDKIAVSGQCQNVGNKKGQGLLKTVFAAPPGYFFVGADLNQAHLFIIANVWQIPALCEAIANGYDPHNFNASTTFGRTFTEAPGYNGLKDKPSKGTPAEAMRNVIKTFIYASVYGAMPETIWRVLTSTETDPPPAWLDRVLSRDDQLNIKELVRQTMPYLLKSLDDVRMIHENWLKGQPEWLDAWQREIDFYSKHGYVQSYLFGRRSGDLGEDQNKVTNFGVLATESDIMRIVESRIDREFPGKIVYQCHDSAAICLPLPAGYAPDWRPAKDAKGKYVWPAEFEEVRRRFEACFHVQVPGWRFPISGEAALGFNLHEV
jgi:uracil-DNA glycosylase